jgi:glycosyltransferase involved in cell wall biosynthesis
VLPCYNEARRLAPEAFYLALRPRPWLRLLFVDDGSTDGTARLLARLAADHERIDVLTLPANRGKASAVHAGLQRALRSEADHIGYWDSDLATPLEELDGMSAEMIRRGAFLVMGARVQMLGRAIHRLHRRHYLGRLFATGASLTVGLPVYDTQCGAKLVRNDAVAREILAPPFVSAWIFDVEILARLTDHDRRHGTRLSREAVVEYPLHVWHDVEGSKLRPAGALRAGLDLARLAWRYRLR